MANIIGPLGLTTATQAELVAELTAAFQAIYGIDINLDQDTPDGQLIGILVQSYLDLEDLLTQIYNGFDPDLAIGNVLDQRVAINGIQRQAGTFTVTDVTIVTSQSVNLYGLDQSVQPIYTVSDAAGNQWQLQNTELGVSAGTNVFSFQASTPGANLTTPNTITIPVTIVLGVTSVNNPTTYTTLGLNEESDATLKIRRQKSVSLASQGYLAGLLAALGNIPGVTVYTVVENNTATTDINGIPSHSIWVIVGGSGAAADIAQAIYTKRNAGCGMFGSVSYTIIQVDGSPFTVYWDVETTEELFIRFTATSLDGINPPNLSLIRSSLPAAYLPYFGLGEEININQLATLVQEIDPNTLVTSAGFGVAAAGPFTETLTPTAKNYVFSLVSTDVIIIPMILSPAIVSVATLAQQQFTGLGGFGSLTYSMQTNPSGGTIDVNGLYTAGSSGFTDVALVTDAQGHTATASITVI